MNYSLINQNFSFISRDDSSTIKSSNPPFIERPAIFIALHSHPSYHLIKNYLGYGTCGWWELEPTQSIINSNIIRNSKSNLDKPSSITGLEQSKIILWAWDPNIKTFQNYEFTDFLEGCELLEYRYVNNNKNRWIPQVDNIPTYILDPLSYLMGNENWNDSISDLGIIEYYPVSIEGDKVWNITEPICPKWIELRRSYSEFIPVRLQKHISKLYNIFQQWNINNITIQIQDIKEVFIAITELNISLIPGSNGFEFNLPINEKWCCNNQAVNSLPDIKQWSVLWIQFLKFWNNSVKNKSCNWYMLEYYLDQMYSLVENKTITKSKLSYYYVLNITWVTSYITEIKDSINKWANLINSIENEKIIVWNTSTIKEIARNLGINLNWDTNPLTQISYTVIIKNDISSKIIPKRIPGFTISIPEHLFSVFNKDKLKNYIKYTLNIEDINCILRYLKFRQGNSTEVENKILSTLLQIKSEQ